MSVAPAKPRILWLTKVDGGRYLITKTKPVRGRILGTRKDEMDAPFDPLAFRHICEASVIYLSGKVLPPLTPTRIRMTVEIL
jgi:hypothetical protein